MKRPGIAILSTTLMAMAAVVSVRAGADVSDDIAAQARTYLARLVSIDTSAPTGLEETLIEETAKHLRSEGIYVSTHPTGRARVNLVARLPATGAPVAAPFIVQAHMDTAPCLSRRWSTPALWLEEKDGQLRACGVVEAKGFIAAAVASFVAIHRSNVALNRELILLLTADGEGNGDQGLRHLFSVMPDLARASGALTPGGWMVRGDDGKVKAVRIENAGKPRMRIKLVAYGDTGWAGRPPSMSANERLIHALGRVAKHRFPVRAAEGWSGVVGEGALFDSLTRTTCHVVGMESGATGGFLAQTATGIIECSLMKDEPAHLMWQMVDVVADARVVVETEKRADPVVMSPVDHEVYQTLARVVQERTGVAPSAVTMPAGVDGETLRQVGIATFGLSPFAMTAAEYGSGRGDDERMSAAAFADGVRLLHSVVTSVVAQPR